LIDDERDTSPVPMSVKDGQKSSSPLGVVIGGRDIIATKTGIGSIRFYAPVKRYKAGRIVKADDGRAMLGVLSRDRHVANALVTTTSQCAPGEFEEFKDFMPHRLELKGGAQLLEWLQQIRSQR
jgi:restriction system protein